MTTPQRNPLTDDHLQLLNKVLEVTPSALELSKACHDCGWDTSEFTAQLTAQHEMAKKAKATFFPNHP